MYVFFYTMRIFVIENIKTKESHSTCYVKLPLHLSKKNVIECLCKCVYLFAVYHSGNILDTLNVSIVSRITISKSNIYMAHSNPLFSL